MSRNEKLAYSAFVFVMFLSGVNALYYASEGRLLDVVQSWIMAAAFAVFAVAVAWEHVEASA